MADRFATETFGKIQFSNVFFSKKKAVEDYAPLSEGQEAHWEVCKIVFMRSQILRKKMSSKVVERMLFLYAKLNPGQGYVQVTSL